MQVEESAKLARLHERVLTFEQGYRTIVGEKGCPARCPAPTALSPNPKSESETRMRCLHAVLVDGSTRRRVRVLVAMLRRTG